MNKIRMQLNEAFKRTMRAFEKHSKRIHQDHGHTIQKVGENVRRTNTRLNGFLVFFGSLGGSYEFSRTIHKQLKGQEPDTLELTQELINVYRKCKVETRKQIEAEEKPNFKKRRAQQFRIDMKDMTNFMEKYKTILRRGERKRTEGPGPSVDAKRVSRTPDSEQSKAERPKTDSAGSFKFDKTEEKGDKTISTPEPPIPGHAVRRPIVEVVVSAVKKAFGMR